jgi:hypothetical protein
MNAQADRQALQFFLKRDTVAEVNPTGRAYIAADGTIWYEFTSARIDDDGFWATTRVASPLASYTLRTTNDMMDLEDVF